MWIINRQAYIGLYTYVDQNDRNSNTEKMIQCSCIYVRQANLVFRQN